MAMRSEKAPWAKRKMLVYEKLVARRSKSQRAGGRLSLPFATGFCALARAFSLRIGKSMSFVSAFGSARASAVAPSRPIRGFSPEKVLGQLISSAL